MKRVLLSVVVFSIAVIAGVQPAAAQKNQNQMSIRVAGYEVMLKGKEPAPVRNNAHQRRRSYYGGRIGLLEVGFNDFRTWEDTYSAYLPSENGFMELDLARSVNVTVNAATFSTSFTRGNWLGISMALGVAYNQYTLDTPVEFVKRERMLLPVFPDAYLKRSKLRTLALHVPLVLEISPTRNFFLSGGGYADVVLWSDAKWKSPRHKLPSPYINFLQVGLTARVGFRDAYIFANYAASELFKTGRGPRLNPCTFGLGFGF